MVKVRQDMTGWKMWEHGVPDSRLTVIKRVEDYLNPDGTYAPQWLCECSCENHTQIIVRGTNLRNGNTKSCGCWMKESSKIRRTNFRKLNEYDLSGEYGIGWTSNTHREFYFDLEDYDKIKDYTWCEHKSSKDNYNTLETYDSDLKKHLRMHWILGYKGCDHKDRNPFNNRKENLRAANCKENARNRTKHSNNTSGIIGVYWNNRDNLWIATIRVDWEKIYLGGFHNKNDAIVARLKAELKYFGVEFAPQRHLFEQYGIVPIEQNDSNLEEAI